MSEVEKIRVVPSGKIYRQMFEAQALLHHQLVQPKSQNTTVVKKGLPIIHTSREASAQGLLNSRQKNWLNGLPFDIYTENPVLYKQHADYIQVQKKKNQYPPEKSMVQALPETVASKPHSSNIVERIETSRHMRHDAALEDLSHELNIIASKLENLIEEATQTLYQQLEEDDKEIEDLLSIIETDEDILQFNYKRLENVWYQIQAHLPKRQDYMQQLDEKFSKVEEIRSVQVQQLFLKYLQMFEKIAYKSKTEIQRMMDNIAQMVNQTLLNNRMNYTNIYFQLMISDTERERKQHIYWKTRVEFWKDVNIRHFLDQFRDYLYSSEVTNPPVIEELSEKMAAEHTSLNNQYKELLNALRNLYPPKCLPRIFEQWYEQTQVVSRGMYETAGIYVLELEKENEVAIKRCTEKFEETKLLLIVNQLCCSDKAATLMEEFSPIIKEIEMNFIGSMVELKMDLDKQFEHSNQLISDIYIFLQSVAKLWQTHETGLGQQEEMLHESLQEHRCWHNEQNQKREDKLDSILDEMRQGDNEGVLNSLQQQTKILLTNIQISYQDFYAEQVKIVKTYPNMVARQLEYYKENICVFFKLQKVDMSQNKIVPVGEDTEEYNETVSHTDSVSSAVNSKPDDMNTPKSLDLSGDTPFSSEPNESSKAVSKSSENEFSTRITSEKTTPTDYDLKQQVENDDNTSTSSKHLSAVESKPDEQTCYLVTDSGTKYQCLSCDEKVVSSEESLLEKPSVQHLYIADDFVHDIKLQIRMNFVNHLDTWLVEAKKNSDHATIAKIEELDAEFNLRTQLHIPRSKRIEHDVYNVRAGELLLHSNRVDEHCQGVEKALTDLKMKFFSIKQQQEKMMGEFQNEIELMEPAFLNITKSGRLITLRNQMSKEIQKLMVNIRTSLRVFRVELDQALQTVRESNASLVQNFRLFSDGGNFCPEEVSQFQETVEDLSKLIDENECHILVEMEGMEATRFDQASRITIEFEDRFKNHIFDLLFMETIARWLTNTQVQIKTHVAKNNTSSKDLSNFLSKLKQNIETCEQPNPDLNKVSSSEIAKMFVDSMEMINSRAKYLKCLKTNEETVILVPCQTALVSEIPSVSKPGKMMLEDSSVVMIKSILRSQKIPEIVEETPESSTEEETSPTSNQENSNDTSPNIKTGKTKAKCAVLKSVSRVYKRHLIVNHSTKAVKLKLSFGEGEDKDLEEQELEEEPSDFLGVIKQLVQNTFVSIGAIAEDYYRQKGSRPITRPQALQDTYENCAELLGDKLVSYYNQAKEYLQRCHAEFQCQLEELENLAKRIPPLLFRSLLEQHLYNLDEEFSKWENTFQDTFTHLEKQQQHHSHLLQPNIGHPQKAAQLQKLNEDETHRHNKFNVVIEKHFKELQKCSIKCSESFLQELVKCSEKLLLQFDDLLISSEVLPAKSDSLRAKQASDFRNPESEKLKLGFEKKRGIWPGVSLIELYTKTLLKSPFPKKTSPSINTVKNTLPQQSTFQSRNDVFQIYVSSFERRIASMEKTKKKLLHEEQRWFEHWKTSIENIKQLFV